MSFQKGDSVYFVDENAMIHKVTVLADEAQGVVQVSDGQRTWQASAFSMTYTEPMAKLVASNTAARRSMRSPSDPAQIVR